MTTKNIGKQKQLALDLIYNKRLTSWWDISANIGVYYFINHLDYESYREDYRRPSCNLSLSNAYNYLQKFVWNCQQDTQVNDKAEVMRFQTKWKYRYRTE